LGNNTAGRTRTLRIMGKKEEREGEEDEHVEAGFPVFPSFSLF
jgi:hypothetical protein